jgi:nicotinamide N-methyltransferase
MADDTDAEESGYMNLFKEPEGYYEPEKQHTIATHTTLNGGNLKLQLVGHNPLWVSINLCNCT